MQRNVGELGTLNVDDHTGRGVYTTPRGSVSVQVLETIDRKAGHPTLVLDVAGRRFRQSGGRMIYQSGPVQGYTWPHGPKGFRLHGMNGQDAHSVRDLAHSEPQTQFRNGFLSRDSNRALPKQLVPGPGDAIFKTQPVPPPPQNNVQLWAFSGQATVPQGPQAPVTVFSVVVPPSSRLRLSTLTINLAPSVLNANNYVFRLLVGESDALNPFTLQPLVGLPGPNGYPLQLSPQTEDLPIVGPGTPIRAVVSAVLPLSSGDQVSMKLQGSLWGDK